MTQPLHLTERDICTRYITPALRQAGWAMTQISEDVFFTDGKIHVRGNLTRRGQRKRADYILFYKPNIPIAVIEAKKQRFDVGKGMQQALAYAHILDIPFVFSSNGEAFSFHDKSQTDENREINLKMEDFPSPEQLWAKYKWFKGISEPEIQSIVSQDYFSDGSKRKPRYYQQIAVNRTIEAIAKGQNRILLVMATGTGKTYTAFQIIHRLWKAGVKKRILFLADRNALLDQTRRSDFKHFKSKMTVVKQRQIDKSYEIYLALYQGLSGSEEEANVYKQFSPDFFDLIVVDECHRGSAKDDSAWREILTYFAQATHIGLTATPKESKITSNIEYFGAPIYTYSLLQGIEDGFLAPYRVIQVLLNVDKDGWRPEKGKTDTSGNLVEDRIYNRKDFERRLIIEERTELVARKVTELLKGYDRFAKTIVFCSDIEHASRMRAALVRQNADLVAENGKYVMQITSDNEEGKRELENFTNPKQKYPVIATTSELMTTGVDAPTCKIIVLDANIQSMTKFKQIIGRGTRIKEHLGKMFFTILDFRDATVLFDDKNFNGEPTRIKRVTQDTDLGSLMNEELEDFTPIYDTVSGEEILFEKPSNATPTILVQERAREPTVKIYVNGVDVSVLVSREVYFDENGKRITLSLKDYTKNILLTQFTSLDHFLQRWNAAERKATLLTELQAHGVQVEDLYESVGREVDLFDLICHVAYDKPPLTRKERANQVQKRDYFTKYGDKARAILNILLEKYADEGVDLKDIKVLQLRPLNDYGSPTEIIKTFGGKAQYLEAVQALDKEVYRMA
jgi:type I restriction enzyme, R subunit